MSDTGRTLRRLVLESLAVLGGILAAFGIDAAWQTAQERDRAADYLDALRSEMAANLEIPRERVAGVDSDVPEIQRLYEALFGEGADEADASHVVEMISMVGPRSVEFERAALTDLLSSGGIQSVDDPEIRRGISRYERHLARTIADHEQFGEFWSGSIVPYFVEYGDLPGTFRRFIRFPNEWTFPETGAPLDVDAFIGNRAFQNLVANYLYWMMQIRAENLGLEAAILEVDSLIAAGR